MAVVPGGRGEKLCRNFVIHLAKIVSAKFALFGALCGFRDEYLEISCNKDTKLIGEVSLLFNGARLSTHKEKGTLPDSCACLSIVADRQCHGKGDDGKDTRWQFWQNQQI